MKRLFTLFFATVATSTMGQSIYTEMSVPNAAPMTEMVVRVETSGAFIVLNCQCGTTQKTYLLINKTSATFVPPTLPTGWSIVTLYKANDAEMKFSIGATFTIVLDNNGNSYMRIH